ncbi:MAG: efflux RND transporter periplasmic adaptor subunit [Prevotella sp.]|nr:efflux RND transporter periplasmic adaptor subunit [Prevotella sp.]
MKQRMYVTLVAAAALLLAGCGKKQPAERQKVVTVKTMKVAPALETVTRNYVGTIEAEEGVNVSFNNIGTVARVLVYEGQSVSKGQALAELDGRNIRNAYAMSKATLDQAEDAYRRMKNLYDKGTLPEIRMVEMESNLQRARSAEAISHKSLEDIVLRAPWSGYVGAVKIHEGANVTPGVSGIHLVKIDRVKVCVPIPEREIGTVSVGQTLTFTVTALGDRTFSGRVVARGLTANPISHAYDVRALVENRDHALLPGMIANVKRSSSANHQIVIPQQAVSIGGNGIYVWVVKGGKAERRQITTGDITNEGVIVETGLTAGETLIIEGQEKVSDGVIVNEGEGDPAIKSRGTREEGETLRRTAGHSGRGETRKEE